MNFDFLDNVIRLLPRETLAFGVVILVLTLIFHIRFSEKVVSSGPTILTTLGIFATFLGIAIGLWEFDADNIQKGIPALLSGLKTAFWASVFGVGAALTIKLRYYFWGLKTIEERKQEGDMEISDIVDATNNVYWSIIGDDDRTLVSQVKLLRHDSNDRLDSLKRAQTEALQALSQMGSATLVEALKDVIRDFNAKISEQFGENFKQLNEAVGQLLVWQQNHRTHVENMSSRLDAMMEVMSAATKNHEIIVQHSSHFSQTASDLGKLIESLEVQKQQLAETAKSLATLLSTAATAVPSFESRIVSIADQLSRSVNDITSQLTQTTANTSNTLAASIKENSATVLRTIEASIDQTTRANAALSQQMAESISKSREQISLLDAALSEELTKSLDSLGRQLSALSEKFVSDYGPLTEQLRRIVQLAKV